MPLPSVAVRVIQALLLALVGWMYLEARRTLPGRAKWPLLPVFVVPARRMGTRLARIQDRRHYGCGSNPSEDDRTVVHSDSLGLARTYFCSTSETSARRGASSGQMMPITPTGSFIASATPRMGTLCTAPSYLSAHAP